MRDSIAVTYSIWGALALLALAAILLYLRVERRRFAAHGKAQPWLLVRLSSLPIALVAAAAVWLPARAIRGPEALAALYLLMFTLGPAVYFALHWLAGRLTTPALHARESAAIGCSGLLIAILPAMLYNTLAPWVHQGALSVQQARRDLAAEVPLAHRIASGRRFLLPDIGEVLTEHWQAPAGIRIERIERELGGQYLQTGDSTGSILCRQGDDVHVFRPAESSPPRWRMYWRDPAGGLKRSDWTSPPGEASAVVLAPVWTQEGFRLPVHVPDNLATLERRWASGRVQQFDAQVEPGRGSATDTCLPLIFRNADTTSVVTNLSIRIWLPVQRRMGVARFDRPPD